MMEKCEWVKLLAQHDLNSVYWAVKIQLNQIILNIETP